MQALIRFMKMLLGLKISDINLQTKYLRYLRPQLPSQPKQQVRGPLSAGIFQPLVGSMVEIP